MNSLMESYTALQYVRHTKKAKNRVKSGLFLTAAFVCVIISQIHTAIAQDEGKPIDPFSIKEDSWKNAEDFGQTKSAPNPFEIRDASWTNPEDLAKTNEDSKSKISLPFLDLGEPKKIESKAAPVETAPPDPGTEPLAPFAVVGEKWTSVNNFAKDISPYVTVVDKEGMKEALSKKIKEEDLAVPLRPLNLAPLPTIKGRADVSEIPDTEQTASTEMPQAIDYENVKLGPKAEDWENPSMAAKAASQSKLAIDRESAKLIRLATLPGNKTLSSSPAGSATASNIPRAQKPKVSREAPVEQPPIAIDPESAAAWAAINAYKKKQLEAIANDNKTLAALHAAILNLGAGKKINFVKNDEGKDSPAPSNSPSPAQTKNTN